MKYRVDINSIPASDTKELMKMQTKINQWLTAGTLKKYQMFAAGDRVIFNICRVKEEGDK